MSTIFFGTAMVSLGLGKLTRTVGSERGLVAICLVAMTSGFAAQVKVNEEVTERESDWLAVLA